jgi:hypothetical protein
VALLPRILHLPWAAPQHPRTRCPAGARGITDSAVQPSADQTAGLSQQTWQCHISCGRPFRLVPHSCHTHPRQTKQWCKRAIARAPLIPQTCEGCRWFTETLHTLAAPARDGVPLPSSCKAAQGSRVAGRGGGCSGAGVEHLPSQPYMTRPEADGRTHQTGMGLGW